MARIEAQAVGGYYKTVVEDLPRIAGLLAPGAAPKPRYTGDRAEAYVAVLDPFAGDGEALQYVARAVARALVEREVGAVEPDIDGDDDPLKDLAIADAEKCRAALRKVLERIDERVEYFACELEGERYEALKKRLGVPSWQENAKNVLRGDAFSVVSRPSPGVGLLYLNAPYDTDRVHGRLEEKALARWTPSLAPGGVLVHIVPHKALAPSARTLAIHYEDLTCYRSALYETYKQVVVFARKRDRALDEPDPRLVEQVLAWSESVDGCCELPEDATAHAARLGLDVDAVRYEVPLCSEHATVFDWEMKPVDVQAILAEYRPWHESGRRTGALRPVARVLPAESLAQLTYRTYDVATPPRAAHVAAGISAGIFNGMKVDPDDPGSRLPPLLVKGVFDREWRDVDQKKNAEGQTTSVVQVQAPRLVVTVLDLRSRKYHTLASTGDRNLPEPRAATEESDALRDELARVEAALEGAEKTRPEDVIAAGVRAEWESWVAAQRARAAELRKLVASLAPSDASDAEKFDVSKMSVGDLIAHYGRGLLRVMERQCRILYDPRRDADDPALAIPALGRRLFEAQAHAVRATLKILGTGQHALCDGEIGVGKTTIVLAVCAAHGARRPLAMCPPHLLDTWRGEVAAVLPDAEVVVLRTVKDVEALAARAGEDRVIVAAMSREAAKLGHGMSGVRLWPDRGEVAALPRDLVEYATPPANDALRAAVAALRVKYPQDKPHGCPRCGGRLPRGLGPEEIAKKRSRCEARRAHPRGDFARLAQELALQLRPWVRAGRDPRLEQVLGTVGRFGAFRPYMTIEQIVEQSNEIKAAEAEAEAEAEAVTEKTEKVEAGPKWPGLRADVADKIRARLAWALLFEERDDAGKALAWLHAAAPDDGAILKLAPLLHDASEEYGTSDAVPWLAVVGDREAAREAAKSLRYDKKRDREEKTPLGQFDEFVKDLNKPETWQRKHVAGVGVYRKGGVLRYGDKDGVSSGSVEAARRLLEELAAMGKWVAGPVCGEPLYQAVPEPRRYPLAKYVSRKYPGLFDKLILDEAHEYASGDSAQSIAAQRLVARGTPVVMMTGSVMNGYAESLHTNMWMLSDRYREEFGRRDASAMVDRYGYRKRILSDKEDGKIVAFGTQSDRVERSERDAGSAPGVLPTFLFRHLLGQLVSIHKADLKLELPPCAQSVAATTIDVATDVGAHLNENYARMLKELLDKIKEDRYSEDGLAGKLFGALSEFGSYLDRATRDVGNCESGDYEVRYPDSVEDLVDDLLVARTEGLDPKVILPKEEAMFDFVERELAEGRRLMVFGWHLEVLPRLQRLIQERIGEDVPVLWADKVPTGKRQAWIDKNIVAKKRRVMVANPVCIQTGLNNLVWFCSEWWHENPACNPITFRQAIGREDRIGQTKEVRIRTAYYAGTLQEKMYELLMNKVAISTAVDGLDPEATMSAAGVGTSDYFAGLSLGRALYKALTDEIERGGSGGRMAGDVQVVDVAAGGRRRRGR